uniref:acetyl-CoA C-acyltransferase n=1 Tax=Aureoumbra lagunensis TaxID=44058 RepID=A0A7S3JSV6_9STRA
MAIGGLMNKIGLDGSMIDYVLYGTVIQEPRTSNLAREAAMHAGLSKNIPAHTVTMACISSNAALCQGVEKIMANQANIILAGGCETFSDAPIRYSRPIRKRLMQASKIFAKQGLLGGLRLLQGLKFKDFAPEAPQIANFTTGEVMGHSSDRMACRFGISRKDQDDYTLRSHSLAQKAHDDGLYNEEIIPPEGSDDIKENGIRVSTPEALAKLKPAFIKGPQGTHTAANSSFLTDGASAAIIMSESKALELGLKPKALIKDFCFIATDPFEQMLLGPAYATSHLLHRNQLRLSDLDVIEIHEAFAGQVLSNFAALDSDKFASDYLNGMQKLGPIDIDKVNTQGGSVSLGHPFAATGTRLVTTAANRLIRDQSKLALVTACADGGLGHAMLLERYDAS